MKRSSRVLGWAASLLQVAALAWMAASMGALVEAEQSRRAQHADAAVLRSAQHGLLSVDAWKRILVDILQRKVEEVELSGQDREAVRAWARKMLHDLIDEVEASFRAQNSRSLSGAATLLLSDLLTPFDDVRAGVPRYADLIVAHLDDPQAREGAKAFLAARFSEAADETVGHTDMTRYNAVLQRSGCADRPQCLERLAAGEAAAAAQVRAQARRVMAGFLLVLLCVGVERSRGSIRWHRSRRRVGIPVGAAILLTGGVLLPMIELEATIAELSFTLAGEPVVFTDQVLFFQSKSIWEVFRLLLAQGDPALVGVAVLVVGFSVVLPGLKLLASLLAVGTGGLAEDGGALRLIERSAKWSMADVMVVALFMAYFAFNGVLDAQLGQLEGAGPVAIFTTNRSTTQIGLVLFVAYVLAGFALPYAAPGGEAP